MRNIGKNWLEWTVFGFSSLLILALLTFLGWSEWTHTGAPARIEIKLDNPVRVGKTWQVKAQVSNPGDQAAEGVEVEVEWKSQQQTAHFMLPQLPRAGERSGYAIFQVVPDEVLTLEALEARVVGYEEG